jgi:hypothetical protein
MNRLSFLLASLLICCAGVAHADDRKKVFSSGSWTLYEADGVDVSYPSRSTRILDKMCVAELASNTASFQIVMMSSQTADELRSNRGCPWIVISSPNWSFRKRKNLLSLSGPFNLVVPADFSGDSIRTAIGDPSGCYSFHAFMRMASCTINVKIHEGKALATFPANGLPAVGGRLLNCAGVKSELGNKLKNSGSKAVILRELNDMSS